MAYEINLTSNPLAIKEQEYGFGELVKFTKFTSCIAVCAKKKNSNEVIGVHLVQKSKDGTPFSPAVADAVLEKLQEQDFDTAVDPIVIGHTFSWGESANTSIKTGYQKLMSNLGSFAQSYDLPDGIYGAQYVNQEIKYITYPPGYPGYPSAYVEQNQNILFHVGDTLVHSDAEFTAWIDQIQTSTNGTIKFNPSLIHSPPNYAVHHAPSNSQQFNASIDPILGSVCMVGFNFAPRSWAFCNGQLLPIAQNSALFSILGTEYGGDGRTTFGLPDLRGRVPMHAGNGPGLKPRRLGQRGGSEYNTLTTSQLPSHSHSLNSAKIALAGGPADKTHGANSSLATISVGSDGLGTTASKVFSSGAPSTNALASNTIQGNTDAVGANQPVYNMQPFLVLNYIIALVGVFPSRS